MPVGNDTAYVFTNKFVAKMVIVVVLLLFPEASGGSLYVSGSECFLQVKDRATVITDPNSTFLLLHEP